MGPLFSGYSSMSTNSYQSIVGGALPRILRSLLQNPIEPNLSIEAA